MWTCKHQKLHAECLRTWGTRSYSQIRRDHAAECRPFELAATHLVEYLLQQSAALENRTSGGASSCNDQGVFVIDEAFSRSHFSTSGSLIKVLAYCTVFNLWSQKMY